MKADGRMGFKSLSAVIPPLDLLLFSCESGPLQSPTLKASSRLITKDMGGHRQVSSSATPITSSNQDERRLQSSRVGAIAASRSHIRLF